MPKTYGITAEITRRAFMRLGAEDRDEAWAMTGRLVEEGPFKGWEEDLPEVMIEEISERMS
jgi:hypothetical protein